MKTNIARILCLVLVLLMSVSVFVGCKGDEEDGKKTTSSASETVSVPEDVIVEVDENAPYEIAENQTVVMLSKEGEATVMTVAEKTTLETFLKNVKAKDGYTIKVSDAAGKEVTDKAAVIADKMVFEVLDKDNKSVEKFNISVATKAEIQQLVQKQEEIDKEQAAAKPGNKPGNTPSKAPSTTSKPGPAKKTIVLNTIWDGNYKASNAEGSAYQSTLTSIERKGIKTEMHHLDAETAVDTITKEVMAGKTSGDIYDVSLAMCRNLARKNSLVNVYQSKTLNKSLYNTAATQSVTFSGKAYGVAYAAKGVNPMGVIYNKELIKKYAGEYDIVKLYNNKKWTFDTFKTIAKKCTVDTNGDNKADIYGFTSNTNIIGMALTSNAGGTALMKNGRVEATMCNEQGVAALEWCKSMFKTDRSWYYKADINVCADEFAAGKAAMFVSYLQFYTRIASKANFSYGFVLMPMGPAQSSYKNGTYDCSLFVVPKTKEARLDDIGTWLNGMASVSGKLITNELTDLARNGFDKTSQNIYKQLVNNMTPEFSTGPFTQNISSQVDSSVTSASKSPAKVMAQIKDAAQKECDDFYGPLY